MDGFVHVSTVLPVLFVMPATGRGFTTTVTARVIEQLLLMVTE
jgi:hypothetical protein